MPQRQIEIQQQVERQLQKLTPQQMMTARMVELSVVELEDRVRTEGYENVALEEGHDDQDGDPATNDNFGNENVDSEGLSSDSMPENQYGDDDIPLYTPSTGRSFEEEMPIGDTRSFIEDLKRQIYDFDITEKQRELIEFLIGTLDNRGFVDRPLESLSDDLLFHFNIDAGVGELEEALHALQRFEPAGIGARDLQECLTIQIDRKLENDTIDEGRVTRLKLERLIILDCFDLLQRQNIEGIVKATKASHEQVEQAMEDISKLNPRPGLALCESADERVQTIEPDFIIETTPDGTINIELNNGEVPELRVSRDYANQLKAYQKNSSKMSRSDQAAFEYTRQKVEGARMFIEAIRQRKHTLFLTMKAIAKFQRDFILTQDDTLLRPMRLVDVAAITGQDLSTVSRVRKGKYAMIDGQLYPLNFFFLRARTNADGEELEHKGIKQRIKELVEREDKANPLSDQKMTEMLMEENLNISRRTVAKYRNELGILSTSERKIL